MANEFKLPELGENIDAGDVVRVLVAEGDTVKKDQALIEVETDKAAIEVPSTVEGVIESLKVKPGDKVKPGQVILTVAGDAPAVAVEPIKENAESQPALTNGASQTSAPVPTPAPTPTAVPDPAPVEGTSDSGPAAPSVRRFAREIGIDIAEVSGTGMSGRISIEDVKAHARSRSSSGGSSPAAAPSATTPLPDFSKWGETERQAMTNVRKATSRHMRNAWSTIPHVTQNDSCDITEFEAWRKKASKEAGVHITITPFLLKVCAAALAKFPQFNASVDDSTGEIVFKKYRNIGVAVDTDRGLLVPVVRSVESKTLVALSTDLSELAGKARDKKLTLDDMQGGCFTITNLGGIGGTGFSPIVNWPEVAILGVSRGRIEPVYGPGGFAPRTMLPLSLSYDHRVIDGADAARFLRWICETVQQPLNLSLEGNL